MPAPQNPSTPDKTSNSFKGGRVVKHKQTGASVWWDMWLQTSWTNEWQQEGDVRSEGPRNFSDAGPRTEQNEQLPLGIYCRDVRDVWHYRQPMGLYYFEEYTVEESWSNWEVFGAILIGVAVVVIGVATGGAAFGAAGGWFVTTAGGATALTTTLAAGGAVSLGAGSIVMSKAKSGENKGEKIPGAQGYVHWPTGAAENYDTTEKVVRDWYLCG
jgi:hypothetical protein